MKWVLLTRSHKGANKRDLTAKRTEQTFNAKLTCSGAQYEHRECRTLLRFQQHA